jgi:hypothetical protein
MRSRPWPKHWRSIDQLLEGHPGEFLDVALFGQSMSDRAFMVRQAERLVKSPKLTREQRAHLETVWLADDHGGDRRTPAPSTQFAAAA